MDEENPFPELIDYAFSAADFVLLLVALYLCGCVLIAVLELMMGRK